MVRLIFTALFILSSALAGLGAGVAFAPAAEPGEASQDQPRPIEIVHLESVNVPVFWNNHIQGFVVAEFAFVVDSLALQSLPLPVAPFLASETFAALYTTRQLEFSRIERHDMDKLKSTILEKLNMRLQDGLFIDVLIQRFNYVKRASAS